MKNIQDIIRQYVSFNDYKKYLIFIIYYKKSKTCNLIIINNRVPEKTPLYIITLFMNYHALWEIASSTPITNKKNTLETQLQRFHVGFNLPLNKFFI